jgi:hypothetical protein
MYLAILFPKIRLLSVGLWEFASKVRELELNQVDRFFGIWH